MSGEEKYIWVANAFTIYVGSGDKSKMEKVSKDDLELALIHFSEARLAKWYQAMDMRHKDLSELESLARTRKEKWIDRVVSFLIGLVTMYIGILLSG